MIHIIWIFSVKNINTFCHLAYFVNSFSVQLSWSLCTYVCTSKMAEIGRIISANNSIFVLPKMKKMELF